MRGLQGVHGPTGTKPFLCLLESSDSATFDKIELLIDSEGLFESSVRSDTSSLCLIGNAYASLFDSANLIISGSVSVSIGISFPFIGLSVNWCSFSDWSIAG